MALNYLNAALIFLYREVLNCRTRSRRVLCKLQCTSGSEFIPSCRRGTFLPNVVPTAFAASQGQPHALRQAVERKRRDNCFLTMITNLEQTFWSSSTMSLNACYKQVKHRALAQRQTELRAYRTLICTLIKRLNSTLYTERVANHTQSRMCKRRPVTGLLVLLPNISVVRAPRTL